MREEPWHAGFAPSDALARAALAALRLPGRHERGRMDGVGGPALGHPRRRGRDDPRHRADRGGAVGARRGDVRRDRDVQRGRQDADRGRRAHRARHPVKAARRKAKGPRGWPPWPSPAWRRERRDYDTPPAVRCDAASGGRSRASGLVSTWTCNGRWALRSERLAWDVAFMAGSVTGLRRDSPHPFFNTRAADERTHGFVKSGR
jgi:hypothetical protein